MSLGHQSLLCQRQEVASTESKERTGDEEGAEVRAQGAGRLLGSTHAVPLHRCYFWERARINRQQIFIQHAY